MRKHLAAALAASLLFIGTNAVFAAQATKATATHATATKATAERTASGTVKSIDANKLVLKTKKGDMTFSLGSTKADNITTGSMVQVHYRSEGKTHVATSVMAETKPTAKK